MMNPKYLLTLSLICLAIFTACDKNDDDHANEVMIFFNQPYNGQVVDNAEDVTVSITLSAMEVNEETHILLYPEQNPDQKIIDLEIHEHKKFVDFIQRVDLSGYASGTNFVLEVVTCLDHDCDETTDASIVFSIP